MIYLLKQEKELPHVDYSCSSWYAGISQALKNNLQLAQNKTVCFIKSMDPRTSIKQTASVLVIRKARGIFRLRTSQFEVQTSDFGIFHSSVVSIVWAYL